jgi:hypothetical protein
MLGEGKETIQKGFEEDQQGQPTIAQQRTKQYKQKNKQK